MGLEQWELERAQLQAVLDDLYAGRIALKDGQSEYVAGVKRRLQSLDDKLKAHGAHNRILLRNDEPDERA